MSRPHRPRQPSQPRRVRRLLAPLDKRRGERGAVTVLAVALIGFLLLLGTALGAVAVMVVAHRTAQSAADLAALAGAQAADAGREPCVVAAGVAQRNGANLTSCVVDDADIRVQVTVTGPRLLGQTHDLDAEARAGPAGGGATGGG